MPSTSTDWNGRASTGGRSAAELSTPEAELFSAGVSSDSANAGSLLFILWVQTFTPWPSARFWWAGMSGWLSGLLTKGGCERWKTDYQGDESNLYIYKPTILYIQSLDLFIQSLYNESRKKVLT